MIAKIDVIKNIRTYGDTGKVIADPALAESYRDLLKESFYIELLANA